jgi:ubiquitin-conjugating enzyme E2 Q
MGEPTYATARATRSLQKLLREALRTQNEEPLHELGWYIHAELINNVYQWIVELHSFEKTLQVAKDLKKAGLTSLVLELRFPSLFPLSPPFIRIIRPQFIRFAEGGGGHITAGGAMCMQLLTNSGWLPSFSIESVLLQVRLAIMNEIPRPARLDFRHQGSDYSVGEAITEYKRVCTVHGWTIPQDIEEIQW